MAIELNKDTPELAQQYDLVSDKQYQHGKLLLGELNLKSGHRVLDIGCGTGRLTEYARERVRPSGEVHGIDPLPLRIEIARRRRKPGLHFGVGQAEDLSAFADGSFDAVYLNSVFHWLPEKASVLLEAFRVLRPGGRLALNSASSEQAHDLQKLIALVLKREDIRVSGKAQPGSTPFPVSPVSLRVLLDNAGFIPLSVQTRHFGDVFPDVDAVLEFSQASSFGNFLSGLAEDESRRVLDALKTELKLHREEDGIHLYRHLIFAIAEKPI